LGTMCCQASRRATSRHEEIAAGSAAGGCGRAGEQPRVDRRPDSLLCSVARSGRRAWLVAAWGLGRVRLGGLAARRPGGSTAWRLDGLAARRRGGLAARRPGGLAARRLGGSAGRRRGGSAAWPRGRVAAWPRGGWAAWRRGAATLSARTVADGQRSAGGSACQSVPPRWSRWRVIGRRVHRRSELGRQAGSCGRELLPG
jgi:hypothetical protein